MKKSEMRIANVPTVVATCCVLHSVCQVHGDSFNDSWLDDSSATTETSQPNRIAMNHNSNERAREIMQEYSCYVFL